MDKVTKILVINGSYRDDGFTDQAVEIAVAYLKTSRVEVETILLRDYPIQFCLNCRECTQSPGASPGNCIQKDGMQALVDKIEQSSAYILAAPTNMGSITAIFKRFMERLVVYAYWPWSADYPKFRKQGQLRKKAMLISSCAAPGLFGRWLYDSSKQLKMAAKIIGADSVGTLFAGQVGGKTLEALPRKIDTKIQTLVAKLIHL